MPPERPPTVTTEDFSDMPIYWFSILDRVVATGDHATAAEAQRQLERLGVRVNYGRPVACGKPTHA